MSISKEVIKYYRFSTGLRTFLGDTVSLNESREIIKRQVDEREGLFLKTVEKAIYWNRHSPYLKLLSLAGCEFEDIQHMVKGFGIEASLKKLVEEGVYLSFEEFKGQKKVIRNGKVFNFRESDFDNPFLPGFFDVESGGSSGAGARTMIDFDFLSREAAHRALVLEVYGLMDAPCVLWFPILPGCAGITNFFRQAKIDRTPVKWFSQVDERSIRPSVKDRFGTKFVVHMGRLFGCKVPNPQYVDLKEPHKIALYLGRIIREHSNCSVWTYVNSAIRICVAARERNISLSGVHFFVSGEPVTQTKVDEIRSSGADVTPYYAFAEGGIVAHGCANPGSADDMHLLRDRIAVVTHKKKPKYLNKTVDALLFTSLLPESPKILLNVETGDYGSINSRRCGCKLGDYGLSDHISNVRSFEKTTSEGMTFMVSDLIRIVEEVLPVRYGGSSTDYQVLEESDGLGSSFINIAVSPRLGPINQNELKKVVIRELAKGEDSKRLMAQVWFHADTIKVKRMDPVPTKRGKIFPFRAVGM
jgi:hypothetical protein